MPACVTSILLKTEQFFIAVVPHLRLARLLLMVERCRWRSSNAEQDVCLLRPSSLGRVEGVFWQTYQDNGCKALVMAARPWSCYGLQGPEAFADAGITAHQHWPCWPWRKPRILIQKQHSSLLFQDLYYAWNTYQCPLCSHMAFGKVAEQGRYWWLWFSE